ncbi:MAG: hypothetical protein HN742_15585 [Lentisphaerae bacterium]|jgi:hypothetical protein|nr:hypothetical protein [Lentisphaerota bacterium]MBT4822740.1 hypothetical protein [Lentisphaerota bacterium]MBT5606239.1 hypothetical protein [Lentisphaerota bacterium]MBT7054308.1 hypothetical protein [Lentisphaerota bacterium]MBT7843299.1 hypothetical protein [Lentisphaerota bacterium]
MTTNRKSQLLPALLLLVAATLHVAGQPSALPDPQSGASVPEASERVGADIVDLYDQAVAHLETVCDDYRRIKSIQLSRRRDLAFDEAHENVSSVMPILQEINKPLLRSSIRRPADIQGHKKEVELVKKEIEMMIDLVAKLLEEIEVIQAELLSQMPSREVTLEEIVQKPEFDPELEPEVVEPPPPPPPEYGSLEEAAREDEHFPAKDLTPIMRKMLDIKDLTQDMRDREDISFDLFRSTDDTGVLAAIIDPNAHKAYGRKIREGGTPAEWLFVDAWYTIGPFPNPNRRNLLRKFPPETVIDLDATYVGKEGKEIRWQWVQSNDPMVTPADPAQYAIYYAYTEVWCDRPMDLWVAVGSDDKANVWLNGMPIWISSDKLKGWQINEGFRKVAFQAGVNTVLYRVENGWLNIGFSLGIRVAP